MHLEKEKFEEAVAAKGEAGAEGGESGLADPLQLQRLREEARRQALRSVERRNVSVPQVLSRLGRALSLFLQKNSNTRSFGRSTQGGQGTDTALLCVNNHHACVQASSRKWKSHREKLSQGPTMCFGTCSLHTRIPGGCVGGLASTAA